MAKVPPKSGPSATFRVGFVKAAVWMNDKHFNVTFSRAYKDNEGNWKDGDSFGHADLTNLVLVATRAEAWIADQDAN